MSKKVVSSCEEEIRDDTAELATKKRSPGFSRKNRGVTPSVAAPGVTNPSDATGKRQTESSTRLKTMRQRHHSLIIHDSSGGEITQNLLVDMATRLLVIQAPSVEFKRHSSAFNARHIITAQPNIEVKFTSNCFETVILLEYWRGGQRGYTRLRSVYVYVCV